MTIHWSQLSAKCKLPRCLTLMIVVAGLLAADMSDASAQSPYGFGFQPFGFYQPYGIQYRSSVPTPPYFAVNPPVYYGKRHYRPYGVSPFAAYPQATAGPSYQSRGDHRTAEGRGSHVLSPNPFICQSNRVESRSSKKINKGLVRSNPAVEDSTATAAESKTVSTGEIKANPFVVDVLRLAKRSS